MFEMQQQKQDWINGLKQFVGVCREKLPIANRDDLKAEEEIQCQIIGGSLIGWLDEYGPQFLQERSFLASIKGWDKDPFIVFTSTEPGLVAAKEILEKETGNIAFLYSKEFTEWLVNNPDPDYLWHIHMWSFFAELDIHMQKKARKYPIDQSDSYWLHKEGTMCGQLFGRGGDHLWKWNGKEPVLLQECINQWVS